jgi:hypothetical protein
MPIEIAQGGSDESQIETDMELPIHDGRAYPTDCTCRVKIRGRVMYNNEWRSVCMKCGSLREATGT